MDQQDKILLKQVAELTEENNRLVRKLVTSQRWNRILFFAKWFVVIALTLGAYYYIQPLVDQVIETYRNLGIKIPETNSLEKWFSQ